MALTDALTKLHTALVDTRRGYAEAAEDAESGDLRALFAEMVALRSRHHDEVHAMLAAMGETPDEGGSLMGKIHETVVDVRSTLTGLGRNALGAFVSGEDHVFDRYDAAIGEFASGSAEGERLAAQKAEVRAMVERMKAAAPA